MTKTKKAVAEEVRLLAHYTEGYIIDPPHPVTINVAGCGGTGSQVLNSLARMSAALRALGHPGLFVRAIDPDKVTQANMGRQLFSPVDIGEYKCVALIGRINRFFGYEWEAVPGYYNIKGGVTSANITISCVDSGKARKEIMAELDTKIDRRKRSNQPNYGYYMQRAEFLQPYQVPYYWMDFGNMRDRGQVVIGTLRPITQPKKGEYAGKEKLPTVDVLHPDIMRDRKGEDQGPSCSLAEALNKQDLFINTNLANMGMAILWKMFRELKIQYHGCYLNLQTMTVNPIAIS